MHKKILTLCLSIAISFTVACESDENNKIAQAESCINKYSNNPSAISSCSSYLEGLSSPRAQTLKCSIALSAGGLSNARIASASQVIDDNSPKNEMKFIALIALNDPAIADTIPTLCQGTDSPGIEFIAINARMGTTLVTAGGLIPANIDENTTISSGDVDDIVAGCTGDTDCLETVGESATSVFNSFCFDVDLDENDVCSDINSAIEGVPDGDFEAIGLALVGLLET